MTTEKFIIFDIFNTAPRIGVLDLNEITWTTSEANIFEALEKMIKINQRTRFVGVVAFRPLMDLEDRLSTRPSFNKTVFQTWSGVRRATTVINTVAFSWNLPVIEVVDVQQEGVEIFKQATEFLKNKPVKTVWLNPIYNAEPNITNPKI